MQFWHVCMQPMFYCSPVLQNYATQQPWVYWTSQVRPLEYADIAMNISLPVAVIDFHSWAWAYVFRKKLQTIRLNNKHINNA